MSQNCPTNFPAIKEIPMTPAEHEAALIQFAGAYRMDDFRAAYDAFYRDYKGRCLAWLTVENQG